MTEIIQKTLRDSKAARWTALLIVSFTMFAGYFLSDVMSPLKTMAESELSWSSTDYGWYQSAYGWLNVFLLFLIFGGIILDKMGVRFTGLTSSIIMVLGTAIKYYAISTHSLDGHTWTILFWTYKAQVWLAAIGFTIFAVGVEVAGITVSKIIYKWFQGKELAMAMGLQLAIARLGSGLAIFGSYMYAKHFGHISAPILLALILLVIGLITFMVYSVMDKKLDVSLSKVSGNKQDSGEDDFKLSDIAVILKNKGWWYIALLCVLFYSAVFPFLKYAPDLMVNKFGIEGERAGFIPSLLPIGTIILTPIFGRIYDKIGKGVSIMIIGTFLLVFVHFIFSLPFVNQWFIAAFLIIILGIGFSLVPSAMWPSVPKIVPEKQLGTAFALIFWVQNWGLMGVPLLIGWVLDKYCITGKHLVDGKIVNAYNYSVPMLIFMSLGLCAIVLAFLLKHEDKKKGYGLQLPNIKK